MSDPITARFRWSPEEFLAAQQASRRYSPRSRKIRRKCTVVSWGVIFLGVGILVTRGFEPMGVVFVMMGTALLAGPLFTRRIWLKHYAQRADQDMQVCWEFHADRIVSRTEASLATFEWRMIKSVLQTPRGFLLHPNDQIHHWVPLHAFREPAEVQAFAELARAKVKQFDRLP